MKYLKVLLRWENPVSEEMCYTGEDPLPEELEFPIEDDSNIELHLHELLEDISDSYGWIIKFHEFKLIEKSDD